MTYHLWWYDCMIDALVCGEGARSAKLARVDLVRGGFGYVWV